MRKVVLFFVVIISINFISCDEELTVSNERVSHRVLEDCPEGTFTVYNYEFSTFRFKRPKFNCESGFWFCTTDGEWVKSCIDRNGDPVPKISEVGAKVYAVPIKENNTVKFYFPKGLLDLPENNIEDFYEFNVDDELIFGDMKLIEGTYLSTFTEEAIVISVSAQLI